MNYRKCGQRGQVLTRVNEKGVAGIWECSPICDIPFVSNEAALIYAINELDDDHQVSQEEST